jgi:hypothetical protein
MYSYQEELVSSEDELIDDERTKITGNGRNEEIFKTYSLNYLYKCQ